MAIPDGSSDSQIASVLAAHGVVTNATVFRYYVKLTSAGPVPGRHLRRCTPPRP